MILSSSRELILDTTFFRSSTIAEARGSIVLMTQLHDVRNFSAYLDISAAVISTSIKVLLSRAIYCYIVANFYAMTHKAEGSSGVEPHTQSQ